MPSGFFLSGLLFSGMVGAPAVQDPPPVVEVTPASPKARREARRERIDAERIEMLKRAYRQRTLGLHPFVRPQFVTSALPTAHFGVSAGLGGMYDETVDAVTGEPGRGSYLAGGAGVDAGIRFGKWVGIDGELNGLTGVSRDPDVALVMGAAAAYTWKASVVVRAIHRDTTALSFRPQIQGVGARGMLLHPGFEAVNEQLQNGQELDLNEAARYTTTRANSLGGLLHVALAQSITRFVGLQVGVAGGGDRMRQRYYDGEEQDVRNPRGLFRSGLALSVDTHPIPLAVLAEYNFNLAVGTGDQRGEVDTSHDVGGGVYLNALTQTLGVSIAANIGDDGRRSVMALAAFRGYF